MAAVAVARSTFSLFVVLGLILCGEACNDHPRDEDEGTASPDINNLINTLWQLDRSSRLNVGSDVRLSYQNKAGFTSVRDVAPRPFVDDLERKLLEKPNFKAFIALLDNYERQVGIEEKTSNKKLTETYQFLSVVRKSPMMKKVYEYLNDRQIVESNEDKFKKTLFQLWFEPYYRSSNRVPDSSGFEHVFVGEVKNKQVTGFHNWIQFYLQERSKQLNYFGYMKRALNSHLVTIKFSWGSNLKRIGSMFFGTSPEFEMSLYTLVYLLGYERLQFTLDGVKVKVVCFGINSNKSIGTCYPQIV